MTWFRQTPDGLVITVRVVPRASKDEVCCVLNDALKIRLRAPPVEGKANRALVDFLAEKLDLSAGCFRILAGDISRTKRVLIRGATPQKVQALLAEAPPRR